MNIDFSSITSTERYRKDVTKLGTTGKKRSAQIFGYITLFTLGVLLSFGIPFYFGDIYFVLVALIWTGFFVFIIFAFFKSLKVHKERAARLLVFCEQNGFTFTNNVAKLIYDNEDVVEFDLPFKTVSVSNACSVDGLMDGNKFSYSMASVFIGSGEGSQFPSIIFSVKLPAKLPTMFINSKVNNLPGIDAVAVNFEKAEEHGLEGDFPDYYTVRIEKNEHIDMYTILTPEVMDTLKRNNYFDIWLHDDNLVFITFGDEARYFAGMPTAFENVRVVMKEIDVIARSMRY